MFEVLKDANNLYEAFRNSKSGSTWKESVQRYEMNFLRNIYRTQQQIISGTYKQKPFYEFILCERGKSRNIRSMHISDRVVQRALCDYLMIPALQKYLIYDNGASVKHKGISFTRRRLETHLHKYYRKHGADGYVLLIDITGFFDNMPHDGLMAAYKEKIKDPEAVAFIQRVVDSFGSKSIGIGSQVSQISGIFYPTRIDNFCKIVKGCRHYGRYMDDIYIIYQDKEYLRGLLREVTEIADGIGLTVNQSKTQIVKLSHGFSFLKIKYILTDTGKLIRRPAPAAFTRERRRLKKFRRLMDAGKMPYKDIEQAYKSWRGNMRGVKAYRSIKRMDKLFNSLFIKPFMKGAQL